MASTKRLPVRPRIAAGLVVMLVASTACTGSKSATPSTTARAVPVAPAAAAATAGQGSLSIATGPVDGKLDVAIAAPTGATEMQIGTDATFASSSWSPVAAAVTLAMTDVGYHEVFARFRDGASTAVGNILVTGVTNDPVAAKVQSAKDGKRPVLDVGLVSTEVLELVVDSGVAVRGGVQPYAFDAPPAGDKLAKGDDGLYIVSRKGSGWAKQVAAGLAAVHVFDVVDGKPMKAAALDDAAGYTIRSTDDPGYAAPRHPRAVSRITRPLDLATTADGTESPTSNQLFLTLPSALRSGATYTITAPDPSVDTATYTFDDTVARSLAVHVDQVGYAVTDPVKVAYLSAWMGAAGGAHYDPAPAFRVLDTTTKQAVFEGTARQRDVPADGELHRADLTGAPVYELDFSALAQAGTYRVCVAALGCSLPFTVDQTGPWNRVTVAVARAMFHQRSGIAMGPPYTSVVRPRAYSPDDGKVAHQSNVDLLTAGGASGSDRFTKLAAAGTDVAVPGAWGGHFDAGDWDRSADHLLYLQSAVDLVELFPERYAAMNLNIPESGDKVPDLLDEGLWDLDLYQRMQMPDGGIRGGIEAGGDPPDRATSWTDPQAVWVYAPDTRSSYVFAAAAAQASHVLTSVDRTRADGYLSSAVRAFDWASAHGDAVPEDARTEVALQRLIAVAALFRATGEAKYQDLFVAEGPFAAGPVDLLACNERALCDAAWIFARADDRPGRRADVLANVLESFKRNADQLVALQETTAFGWTLEHPVVPLIWGLGPGLPKTLGLLRAWVLLHDERYRAAALGAVGFSMGANPLDTVMMTGFGSNPVRHPLLVDATTGGLPVWAGIPIYGWHQLGGGDNWVTRYFLGPAGTTPPVGEVPYLWSWFDLPNVAMFNEFTVHQSHAVALFEFGVLAAADPAA